MVKVTWVEYQGNLVLIGRPALKQLGLKHGQVVTESQLMRAIGLDARHMLKKIRGKKRK